MIRRKLLLCIVMIAGASVSSCGEKSEGEVGTADDPLAARTTSREDQYGKGFGKAFRASPNSEPAKVSDNDVTPVSRTAEPLDVD